MDYSIEGLPGSLGTSSSLAMRLGQIVFSTASLLFMCVGVDFYSYTVFANFVVVMGILIPWSLTMAIVDAWSLFTNRVPNRRKTVFMIVVGDMFLAYILLAAAASTAGVTDAMIKSGEFCSSKLCSRYQLSAAMAFLGWFLLIASGLFNLWLLPSQDIIQLSIWLSSTGFIQQWTLRKLQDFLSLASNLKSQVVKTAK